MMTNVMVKTYQPSNHKLKLSRSIQVKKNSAECSEAEIYPKAEFARIPNLQKCGLNTRFDDREVTLIHLTWAQTLRSDKCATGSIHTSGNRKMTGQGIQNEWYHQFIEGTQNTEFLANRINDFFTSLTDHFQPLTPSVSSTQIQWYYLLQKKKYINLYYELILLKPLDRMTSQINYLRILVSN